jgi:hypothetical protein
MEYKESPAFLNANVSQYGSHMIMTNVKKPTKTKIINMDTRFVDEYQMNTNVYPITLSDKITNVKSMKIVSAEIPASYYNISAALGNNYFMVTNNYEGVDLSLNKWHKQSAIITVPDGFYNNDNMSVLINSINDQLFNLSSLPTQSGYGNYPFEVIFDISANAKTLIYMRDETVDKYQYNFQIDFAVNTNGEFDKYNFKNKLGWLLGFRNTTYRINGYWTTGTSKSLMTSDVFANFNIQRYMYLTIDESTNGSQNSFLSSLPTSLINKNIIARITPNATFGDVIYANCGNGYLYSDCRQYTSKIDIQRLNIQLINEFGQSVNLNGLDFSFCMEIDYE